MSLTPTHTDEADAKSPTPVVQGKVVEAPQRFRPFGINRDVEEIEAYAEAALTDAKMDGQLLAVRVRTSHERQH